MTTKMGDVLGGKYRLQRLCGEGGMGAVYRAEHVVLGKAFAVKLLHPQYAMDPELFKRFQLEAQAAAAVGHRGIVEVYDIGQTAEGTPFLVMELLHGESLADLLERQGTLDPRIAVEIVAQVLSALVAVHAKKILHRDLKPENIFLSREDGSSWRAKILDFGISKVVGPKSVNLTATGSVLGTANYMSPEQARGAIDVDLRADVWAVGAILYRSLVGRLPFEGDSYNEVLAKILTDPVPSPRAARPEVPEALERVVLRALAKDRNERYPSAESFLADLQPFKTAKDEAPSPWDGAAPRTEQDDDATEAPEDSRHGAGWPLEAEDSRSTSAFDLVPAATPGRSVAPESARATTPYPMPTPRSRCAIPMTSLLPAEQPRDPTPSWMKTPPGQPDTLDAGMKDTPRAPTRTQLLISALLVGGLAIGVSLGAVAWSLGGRGASASSAEPIGIVAQAPPASDAPKVLPPAQRPASEPAAPPPPVLEAEVALDLTPGPSPPATSAAARAGAPEAARPAEKLRQLTTQEIDTALRQLQPRLKRCIGLAQPAPAVVRVRIRITSSGAVQYDRATPTPPANVAACLGEAVGGVRFLGSRVEPTAHVVSVTSAPASERPTKSGGLRSSPFDS